MKNGFNDLTLGKFLKQKLEEKNLTLKDVHEKTKVSNRYLKIIFEDDFENYPPEVYIKGYLKKIAKLLEIDFSEIEFFLNKVKLKKIEAVTPKYSPVLSIERKNKIFKFGIIVCLIFILIVFVIFHFKKGLSTEKTANNLSNKSIIKKKKVKVALLPKKKDNESKLKTTFTSSKEKDNRSKINQNIVSTIVKKDNNSKLKKNITDNKILKIYANELTWIRVTMDNKTKKTLFLKKGDNVTFHAKKFFRLDIGNAGGIKLILNDKELGAPGKKGEVKHITLY